MTINTQTLVPYILHGPLKDSALAISMASRMNLPGPDDLLYVSQFQTLLAQNNVSAAAKLAAESPNGVLRR